MIIGVTDGEGLLDLIERGVKPKRKRLWGSHFIFGDESLLLSDLMQGGQDFVFTNSRQMSLDRTVFTLNTGWVVNGDVIDGIVFVCFIINEAVLDGCKGSIGVALHPLLVRKHPRHLGKEPCFVDMVFA